MYRSKFIWTDPESGFEIRVNYGADGSAEISTVVELCQVELFKESGEVEVHLPTQMLEAFGRDAALREIVEQVEGLRVAE